MTSNIDRLIAGWRKGLQRHELSLIDRDDSPLATTLSDCSPSDIQDSFAFGPLILDEQAQVYNGFCALEIGPDFSIPLDCE